MLDYLSTQNVLHVRTINFTLQEYMFVLQVVLGEDERVAYASVFDSAEFNRNVPSDDEEEYLSKFRRDAEILLEQQQCKHLREYLEDEYNSEVQSKASHLKNFKFSGADIQQLLANLLQNRVGDGGSLDDASVKDVISLIKTMYEQGALDSGDSFQKHFISVHEKFNALCPNCNHEMDAYAGVNCRCGHCGQLFKWSETNNRFYPEVMKL